MTDSKKKKLVRKKDTEQSKKFWNAVHKAYVTVYRWPKWKRDMFKEVDKQYEKHEEG